MKDQPTYTAEQLLELAKTLPVESETFKILAGLIEEEIDLYSDEDIQEITKASFILFNRALLSGALKSFNKR